MLQNITLDGDTIQSKIEEKRNLYQWKLKEKENFAGVINGSFIFFFFFTVAFECHFDFTFQKFTFRATHLFITYFTFC